MRDTGSFVTEIVILRSKKQILVKARVDSQNGNWKLVVLRDERQKIS